MKKALVLILVLLIGSAFAYRQVFRLFREIGWVNSLVGSNADSRVRAPILLAPMATMLNAGAGSRGLSTTTTRAILDSVGTRLDEGRELNRYLIGLLVFLGLLGTFWGLLQTVHSISGVIDSMKTGADTSTMFDDLKNGLSAPIAGMSLGFTSSLFGLAGSLILGFLDLQAGQAQNRFYTELEDWLSTTVYDHAAEPALAAGATGELNTAIERLRGAVDQAGAGKTAAAAMANLAEAIQVLVQHMRTEQSTIREWVDGQAEQQREIRKLLEIMLEEKVNS